MSITTLTYFELTDFASSWRYVRYCHIVLNSVTLAAIAGKTSHEFLEQDPLYSLPANLQDNDYVCIILELKHRPYQFSILSAIVNVS